MSVTLSSLGGGKTRYALTLLSGTSWTVPTGVAYVNVTLYGAGGAGGAASGNAYGSRGEAGYPGQVVSSIVTTTPGASITYAIGAGGPSTNGGNTGGNGGTTTFTGATSAGGGYGGSGASYSQNTASTAGANNNGGAPSNQSVNAYSGTGGAGKIDIEYWA